MINKELYLKIQEKYGDVGSWAVWDEEGEMPKSNMGNMDIFDLDKNPNLLNELRNDVVMIGLNFSRPVNFTKPYQNFHDRSPYANDFKIRYAFNNTRYYGAYMTDVIKNTVIKSSQNMRSYINKNPKITKENIAYLREELEDLEAHQPLILAFGVDAYELLNDNLNKNHFSKLIKITHYSHFISKENYKKEVLNQIQSALSRDTAS